MPYRDNEVSALAMIALFCMFALVGCSGEGTRTSPAYRSTNDMSANGEGSRSPAPRTSTGLRELNDGDAEKIDDRDTDNREGNHEDGDGDASREYESTYDNGSYHDSDDKGILTHGYAVNPSKERMISAFVERYFVAAAAEDGVTACSMIEPRLASSLPRDYGGAAGPAYLRGAMTCQSVMSLIFKHFHSELTGVIKVTSVRRMGDQTLVLLGSTTMPAGDISVEPSGGTWRIASLLGSALP
jgi:hypothetical protein